MNKAPTNNSNKESDSTPYGYIYKITHPAEKGCYVGKTEVSIEERWKKHLSDGDKAFDNRSKESKKTDGRLHERIAINRKTKDQFKHEQLDVGYSKCHLVQLEHDYIIEHDALNPLTGWNIILPNPAECVEDLDKGETYRIDGKDYKADSLSELCRKANVAYSSVMYWRKKGRSIEEAILRVREHQLKPKKVYIIFRQRFKSIRALSKSRINEHNIGHKILERRISVATRKGELETQYDSKGKSEGIILVPEILFKQVGKDGPYEVQAPDGVKYGPTKFKKQLWVMLLEKYPDIPPYQTVVNRLTGLGWSTEQAFDFKVSPNFVIAHEFVVEKGYKYEPPWETVKKSDFSNAIPVVLHETKEVFLSRKVFSEKYGLKEDLVSDRFAKGFTAIDVLSSFDLKP